MADISLACSPQRVKRCGRACRARIWWLFLSALRRDGSRSNWPPSVGLKKRGPEKRARGGVVRAPARGRSASEGARVWNNYSIPRVEISSVQ